MTEFLLVRHAHCAHVGVRLVGRTPGILLSPDGVQQAERLGQALASTPLDAIYSSPLERAVQTAQAIARHHQVRVIARPSLTDVDFGDWTGATFDALDNDPRWQAFNSRRSSTPIPGGEHPRAVQARAVGDVLELAAQHDAGRIAIISHADVIRSIITHVRGMSLDHLLEIDVEPAGVIRVMLPLAGMLPIAAAGPSVR